MIYSRWRPAKGGYDYYDASDKDIPMGNDLPKPSLPLGTDIGVASVDAGRVIPAGARYVGSGPDACGLIAPQKTSALGAVKSLIPTSYMLIAAGVVGGWFLAKWKR